MNEENQTVRIISDNARISASECRAILRALTDFLGGHRHELSARRIAMLETQIAQYAERSKSLNESEA